MWKQLCFIMLASTALCANEHNEFNNGIKHLRLARQACEEINSYNVKKEAGNCLDTAIQILSQTGFIPHGGQVANAVFFDICNALLTVPDDSTYKMMKEITLAEEAFRKSLFIKIEHDMELNKK